MFKDIIEEKAQKIILTINDLNYADAFLGITKEEAQIKFVEIILDELAKEEYERGVGDGQRLNNPCRQCGYNNH